MTKVMPNTRKYKSKHSTGSSTKPKHLAWRLGPLFLRLRAVWFPRLTPTETLRDGLQEAKMPILVLMQAVLGPQLKLAQRSSTHGIPSGLASIDEQTQAVLPTITADNLALLANTPGDRANAALAGNQSEYTFAMQGSEVTASEVPLFNPEMALLRPVPAVPDHSQFVGKLKKIKGVLSGNARIDSSRKHIEGTETYNARSRELDAMFENARDERIEYWDEKDWKQFANENYDCSVQHSEQINPRDEGRDGKALYAYLVQVVVLPNKDNEPEVHVAIETHHSTRPIVNDADEGDVVNSTLRSAQSPSDPGGWFQLTHCSRMQRLYDEWSQDERTSNMPSLSSLHPVPTMETYATTSFAFGARLSYVDKVNPSGTGNISGNNKSTTKGAPLSTSSSSLFPPLRKTQAWNGCETR